MDEPALANIVATMPGYAYVINNYGSYSNSTGSQQFPLNTVQKLAFVYNTAKLKNIHTDSLITLGVDTAAIRARPIMTILRVAGSPSGRPAINV